MVVSPYPPAEGEPYSGSCWLFPTYVGNAEGINPDWCEPNMGGWWDNGGAAAVVAVRFMTGEVEFLSSFVFHPPPVGVMADSWEHGLLRYGKEYSGDENLRKFPKN